MRPFIRQHFDTVDGTNRVAGSFATDAANHGLIVTADAQSAGRGQYERTWQAPARSSVLLSVLLFPPPTLRRPSLLTAWAAVSVCKTIESLTPLHASIKWPNDILVDSKKICGILCEAGARHIVAGIGLNVLQTTDDFFQAGLPNAASIRSLSGISIDVEESTSTLIQTLQTEYQHLMDGDQQSLEAEWKQRLGLVNRQVVVEKMDGSQLSGALLDLSFDAVIIEIDNEPTLLPPEIIRHIDIV